MRALRRTATGRGTRRSVTATLLFLALTTPFGTAAHLISEFVGLGWHDDADVILSSRHAYLAIVAFATLGSLVAALLRLPRSTRRNRVASLIDDLPFKGRGVGFAALSFVTQFSFFGLTQIGEGCPLCAGDALAGGLAAAMAALIGALLVTFGKRKILQFTLAVVRYLIGVSSPKREIVQTLRGPCMALYASRRRTPFAFRYRPPPLVAA